MIPVFPKQTVDYFFEEVRIMHGGKKPNNKTDFNIFRNTIIGFKDSHYSFTDNLRTGQYTHYFHDSWEKNIKGYNCTNIIPSIYIYAKALGFNPQIVQYTNFKNISKDEDKNKPVQETSHFALVVDVGKSKPYLVDPFHEIFGPILEQSENFVRVGKLEQFVATKREFEQVELYSAQEFVNMMDKLLEPAHSLEMLIAGQKIFSKFNRFGQQTDLMVYYDDQNNCSQTRLFIENPAITNKAIICSQEMDLVGQTNQTYLDLYYAKDRTWNDLVEEKKLARINYSQARKIRRVLNKLVKPKKNQRIGPALDNPQNADAKATLVTLVDEIMQSSDLEVLKPQILARTLYEAKEPGLEYLFSHQEHDQKIHELIEQDIQGDDELRPILVQFYHHNWKLKRLPRKEVRRLNIKKKKINDRLNKVRKKLNSLNNYRYSNRTGYDRAMDQVQFANQLLGEAGSKEALVSNMQREVVQKELDTKIGYLAMVADFFPFAFSLKKDLELDLYMDHIREKVKARKSLESMV